MASKPQSISVKDLSAHVDRALENARRKRPKLPPIKRDRDFIFDYPWIIGFILRDIDFTKNFSELQGLAQDVATELQAGAGGQVAAGRAQPAVLIHGGNVTMGFFPHDVFNSLHE
ncbi:MAG TPA: hypothetical protein VF601_19660 [Beijerinckiaceae bacterium]|jgi:hypothetical protein